MCCQDMKNYVYPSSLGMYQDQLSQNLTVSVRLGVIDNFKNSIC